MHLLSEFPGIYSETETRASSPNVNFSTRISGRRIFLLSDTAQPDASKNTLQKLTALRDEFTKSYGHTLNQISHYYHQRKAQLGYVKVTFEGWQKELRQLEERMNSSWNRAKMLYGDIPKIANPKEKAKALSCMMHLELVADKLTEKSKSLCNKLADQSSIIALEEYKGKVKKAKSLTEIQELDIQILKEPQQNQSEKQSKDNNTSSLSTYDAVKLPTENHFRAGQSFTSWQLVGYTEITAQISELTRIAKGLYSEQIALDRQVKKASKHPVDTQLTEQQITECLNLEECINDVVKQLHALPFSNQIHAGWYYAVGLKAQAKTLHTDLEQLKLLNQGTAGLYNAALHKLIEYFERSEFQWPRIDITMILCFAEATREACAITFTPKQTSRTYTFIEQTLAHEATTLLPLTEPQAQIPTKVFGKWLHSNLLSGALPKYLMKGFLKTLHFSHELIDPQFEAVLYMLKFDTTYKASFEAYLKSSKEARELHDSYIKQSDMSTNLDTLKSISAILTILNSPTPQNLPEQTRNIDMFIRYQKSQHLLQNLISKVDKNDPTQNIRLKWIKEQFKHTFTSHQNALNIKEKIQGPLLESLFKTLLSNLIAADPEQRETTDEKILDILESNDFCNTTLPDTVKLLMQRWAFERFMQSCKRKNETSLAARLRNLVITDTTDVEDKMLVTIFNEYLKDPTKRALWRCLYDTGYMEIAVREFDRKMKHIKTNPTEQLWDSVVSIYDEFRKIIEEQGLLLNGSEAHTQATELYNRAKSCFGNRPIIENSINTKDAYGIASWLCVEMNQFLTSARTSFLRE